MQEWNQQNPFPASAAFDDTVAATAGLRKLTAQRVSFQKVQYKLVRTPDSPATIHWAEIFSPASNAKPTYRLRSWTPATGETETEVYTIDPIGDGDGAWSVEILNPRVAYDADGDQTITYREGGTGPLMLAPNQNDDLPGSKPQPDANNDRVDGPADLKDFLPVFLDLKTLVEAMPPASGVTYKLKHEDGAVNFVYTNLTRANAYGYLAAPGTGFGPALDQPAANATTLPVTASGVDLFAGATGSPAFLTAIQSAEGGVILIEARQFSLKPLVLIIERAGQVLSQTEVPLLLARAELAVDANRDGQLRLPSEDASDQTSLAKPYRFWINDDIDRSHTVDGNDIEEDDLFESPNGKLDWDDGQINSKRDLEDFARLKIYLGGLQDAVTQGTIKVGLKWKPAPESTGAPSLKVWRNLSPNGGTEYLTDEAVAQQHLNLSSPGLVQGTTPYLIPTQYWTDVGLSAAQPYGNLLFEGCTAGKGQLVITLHNSDGTEIGEGPGVWIELKSIEEFYERWTAGDGNGGDPATAATRKKFLSRSGNSVSYGAGFEYAADAPEEKKYILYVHGWNMQPEEKNRFAETAFKRLYWQGYKGRFGVFCWPATYNFGALVTDNKVWKNKLNSGYSASTDPTNYDRGEWTAWKSSFPLMQLLNGPSGLRATYPSLNVVAHSMGNIVIGEALRRLAHVGTTNVVDCYVASQAALPAHSYDGTVASDLLADVPLATLVIYADGGHPETPNIYPTWLAENGGAAGRRVNFYNVNDFALWHDSWEANQFLKPDGLDDPDQPWTYKYLGEINAVQDLFKRRTPVWSEDLHLGDATIPQNRWEIMAFAAEARSRAVGAKDSELGMDRKVDLQTIWPDDTGLRGSDGQKWGAHKWHSAQFRSTNMRQGNYWKTLLSDRGFNLLSTP